MNKTLSDAFSLLRFPMALMVVMIHSNPYLISYHGQRITMDQIWFDKVTLFFSHSFPAVAVPLFFIISGYLFFSRVDDKFCANDYTSKIKKRAKSLLLPYMVWNTLYLFIENFKSLPFLKSVFPNSEAKNFSEILSAYGFTPPPYVK